MVDVSEFLRETRIAAIFARDGSGIIRLQFAPGGHGFAPVVWVDAEEGKVLGMNNGLIR